MGTVAGSGDGRVIRDLCHFDLCSGKSGVTKGFDYSRTSNPTVCWERALRLESGRGICVRFGWLRQCALELVDSGGMSLR